MPKTSITSDVAPVLGADVSIGDRILSETGHGWSSPITHFKPLPDDYWGTRAYGWTRVAFAGDIRIRPIAPDEVLAILVAPEAA